MSTAIPVLVAIALVAAIALCGVAIWAAVELAKTARSSRRLAEDLDARLIPLADKLDVSVDAFNAELLRVDLMVDQLEVAVDRFTGTVETVHEVVDAPIHLVNEVAERFRRGFRRRGAHAHRHEHGPHDQSESDEGTNVVVIGAVVSADEPGDPNEMPTTGSDGPSVIWPGTETDSQSEPEERSAPASGEDAQADEPEPPAAPTSQTDDPEEA